MYQLCKLKQDNLLQFIIDISSIFTFRFTIIGISVTDFK